ncbi:MAG: D-aminoacyl-tRNA deacylase [Opitutaceae bacterium]
MRAVIQRVTRADVKIAGRTAAEIGPGLLVLLGVAENDTPSEGEWLAGKIARLRIFADDAGLMNRSVEETGGGILVISQFTLLASTRKGTRPSFNDAAKPELAKTLYESFLGHMQVALTRSVARGEFGANMQVSLVNDGPVTLIVDSLIRE